MQRNFLEKFLTKVSDFPSWIKEIIYEKLSGEMGEKDNLSYVFATYKPVLTDKGKCELDKKQSCFDSNIYTIFEYCDNGLSISEITLNTFMSLEEVANYFLFGVDEGYMQIPDDSRIINIAGFLAGKYRTGEYFVNNGEISQEQLSDAVDNFQNEKPQKKFGQFLVELGLIAQKQLDIILKFKQEAQKRFVLDHNEVPSVKVDYTKEEYENQIKELKEENLKLKQELEKANKLANK